MKRNPDIPVLQIPDPENNLFALLSHFMTRTSREGFMDLLHAVEAITMPLSAGAAYHTGASLDTDQPEHFVIICPEMGFYCPNPDGICNAEKNADESGNSVRERKKERSSDRSQNRVSYPFCPDRIDGPDRTEITIWPTL
jgi:hypothetical protein